MTKEKSNFFKKFFTGEYTLSPYPKNWFSNGEPKKFQRPNKLLPTDVKVVLKPLQNLDMSNKIHTK